MQGTGNPHPLFCCRAELEVQDTVIGPGKQDYMHGIVGGATSSPPLVCLPGYGAGAAFFFRNFPSLCQHFRTYAVDPLGTGMSGWCHALCVAAPCASVTTCASVCRRFVGTMTGGLGLGYMLRPGGGGEGGVRVYAEAGGV